MSVPGNEALAGSGAKKLNEGLPLERSEIAGLASLFLQNKFFAHIKFGIENGRVDPEEIIKNVRKEDASKFEFVLLLGYLLRNGLDPNYYFEGPYKIKVHIAVFINTIANGSNFLNCIFDTLKQSGSNFLSAAYSGGRSDSSTVQEIIKFAGNTQTIGEIELKEYFYTTTGTGVPDSYKMNWSEIINIVLDRKLDFPKTINKDPLKSVTLFNMAVTTSAIKLIDSAEEPCFFWNSYLGMQQSVYLSINGQNYDVFQHVLDKGGEMDYLSMTELICRYNLSAKDNILRETYGRMISYAIGSGAKIDNRQLQLLSLEGTVDLIEGIRESYRNPEWKKLCKKTGVKDSFSSKRLRQIAFDLNIDFGLTTGEICDKLEKISNIDRLTYFNTSMERQKERIARTLMEAGDVREGDSLERFRCNVKASVINNPYAYNDGRVAFYTDGGELWCFTSDLFDSLIATGINPYTKKKLPDSFLETIKSQVNILEFLGLKKAKDQRSIDESLKEVFDTKNEVSNRYSDDIYNTFVNMMAIMVKIREPDIRGKMTPSSFQKIIKAYLNMSYYYFSDCKDMISLLPVYTNKTEISAIQSLSPKNLTNPPSGTNFNNTRCYKIFETMKVIEYLKDGKFLEIFYVILGHLFISFERKFSKSVESSGGKQHYYSGSEVNAVEEIMKNTFSLS